jgi:hypothetical protein
MAQAWQEFPRLANLHVGKAILSFPGFIVQPAIIAGID